jgi:hypothetical protein
MPGQINISTPAKTYITVMDNLGGDLTITQFRHYPIGVDVEIF